MFRIALDLIDLSQGNQLITQMKMIITQGTTYRIVSHQIFTQETRQWDVKLFAVGKGIELWIEFVFSDVQQCVLV